MKFVLAIFVLFSLVLQSTSTASENAVGKKTARDLPYFRLPWMDKDYQRWNLKKTFPEKLTGSQIKSLPSRVDNSIHEEWPGIGNQGKNNCCSQEGTIAGMLTYELNVLRRTNAKQAGNRLPAHFSWNFFNSATNNGAEMIHGLETAYEIGIPSEQKYGGRYAKSVGHWPNGYEVWHEAMKNRIAGYGFLKVDTPESLLTAKAWIYNHAGILPGTKGGMLTIDGTDVWESPMKVIPKGNHEAGKKIWTDWGPKYGGHVMCVVGYDDQIGFDVNNDGKITNDVDINNDEKITLADYEKGAFIVANSWGKKWGNDGKIYILYRCLMSRADFWDRGPFMGYAVPEYSQPAMTLRIKAVYPKRNGLTLTLKLKYKDGKEVSWKPKVLFNKKTGAVPLGGPGTEGEDFELGLDLTDMAKTLKAKSVHALMQDLINGSTKLTMTWKIKDQKSTGLLKEAELLFWNNSDKLITKFNLLEKEVELSWPNLVIPKI